MTRTQLIKAIAFSLCDNAFADDEEAYEMAEVLATDLDTEFNLVDEDEDEA